MHNRSFQSPGHEPIPPHERSHDTHLGMDQRPNQRHRNRPRSADEIQNPGDPCRQRLALRRRAEVDELTAYLVGDTGATDGVAASQPHCAACRAPDCGDVQARQGLRWSLYDKRPQEFGLRSRLDRSSHDAIDGIEVRGPRLRPPDQVADDPKRELGTIQLRARLRPTDPRLRGRFGDPAPQRLVPAQGGTRLPR